MKAYIFTQDTEGKVFAHYWSNDDVNFPDITDEITNIEDYLKINYPNYSWKEIESGRIFRTNFNHITINVSSETKNEYTNAFIKIEDGEELPSYYYNTNILDVSGQNNQSLIYKLQFELDNWSTFGMLMHYYLTTSNIDQKFNCAQKMCDRFIYGKDNSGKWDYSVNLNYLLQPYLLRTNNYKFNLMRDQNEEELTLDEWLYINGDNPDDLSKKDWLEQVWNSWLNEAYTSVINIISENNINDNSTWIENYYQNLNYILLTNETKKYILDSNFNSNGKYRYLSCKLGNNTQPTEGQTKKTAIKTKTIQIKSKGDSKTFNVNGEMVFYLPIPKGELENQYLAFLNSTDKGLVLGNGSILGMVINDIPPLILASALRKYNNIIAPNQTVGDKLSLRGVYTSSKTEVQDEQIPIHAFNQAYNVGQVPQQAFMKDIKIYAGDVYSSAENGYCYNRSHIFVDQYDVLTKTTFIPFTTYIFNNNWKNTVTYDLTKSIGEGEISNYKCFLFDVIVPQDINTVAGYKRKMGINIEELKDNEWCYYKAINLQDIISFKNGMCFPNQGYLWQNYPLLNTRKITPYKLIYGAADDLTYYPDHGVRYSAFAGLNSTDIWVWLKLNKTTQELSIAFDNPTNLEVYDEIIGHGMGVPIKLNGWIDPNVTVDAITDTIDIPIRTRGLKDDDMITFQFKRGLDDFPYIQGQLTSESGTFYINAIQEITRTVSYGELKKHIEGGNVSGIVIAHIPGVDTSINHFRCTFEISIYVRLNPDFNTIKVHFSVSTNGGYSWFAKDLQLILTQTMFQILKNYQSPWIIRNYLDYEVLSQNGYLEHKRADENFYFPGYRINNFIISKKPTGISKCPLDLPLLTTSDEGGELMLPTIINDFSYIPITLIKKNENDELSGKGYFFEKLKELVSSWMVLRHNTMENDPYLYGPQFFQWVYMIDGMNKIVLTPDMIDFKKFMEKEWEINLNINMSSRTNLRLNIEAIKNDYYPFNKSITNLITSDLICYPYSTEAYNNWLQNNQVTMETSKNAMDITNYWSQQKYIPQAALNVLNSTMSGAVAGASVGGVGALVGVGLGLISGVGGAILGQSRLNMEIQQAQEQWDNQWKGQLTNFYSAPSQLNPSGFDMGPLIYSTNESEKENGYELFKTLTINDLDRSNVWEIISTNGYPFNSQCLYEEYDNRQNFNILNFNFKNKKPIINQILKTKMNSLLFSQQTYIDWFILKSMKGIRLFHVDPVKEDGSFNMNTLIDGNIENIFKDIF